MRVTYTSEPTGEDFFTIFNCLDAETTPRIGPSSLSQVALLLHDEASTVVGGLWGHVSYKWLTIDLLFVPADMRFKGLGSELVIKAEAVALERGCNGIQVMTYAFQAPDFYERHGFEIFTKQKEPSTEHVQVHLIKHLCQPDPDAKLC